MPDTAAIEEKKETTQENPEIKDAGQPAAVTGDGTGKPAAVKYVVTVAGDDGAEHKITLELSPVKNGAEGKLVDIDDESYKQYVGSTVRGSMPVPKKQFRMNVIDKDGKGVSLLINSKVTSVQEASGETASAESTGADINSVLKTVTDYASALNAEKKTDGKIYKKVRGVVKDVIKAVPGLTEEEYANIGGNLCKKENEKLLASVCKGEIDPEELGKLKGAVLDNGTAPEVQNGSDTKSEENANKTEENAKETPEVPDDTGTPNIDTMENKNLADAIRRCFPDDPAGADKFAGWISSWINEKDSWKEYLAKNGTNKAVMDKKAIPTLLKAYNEKHPEAGNLSVSKKSGETASADRGTVVVPEGFGKGQVDFGNRAFLMDIGYFTVNYDSDLIKSLIREDDDGRRKKILKKVILSAKGTPAAKYLMSGKDRKAGDLMKMIEELAHVKGMPVTRKPLKVSAEDLQKAGDDGDVTVTPVKVGYSRPGKVEAASWDDMSRGIEILNEGLLDFFKKDKEDTAVVSKSVPVPYLAQFYEVATDSAGIGRFLTDNDNEDIANTIGSEKFTAIKASGKNVRAKLVDAYVAANDGVPPFYVLVPRKNPKERLRVSEDTFEGKSKCVKTIDGPNKAFVYLIPADVADAIFEVA